MLGKRLWDLYPEVIGTRSERTYLEAMSSNEPRQLDIFEPRSRKRFQLRVYPGPDGLSIYFIDTDQQHQMEAERDRANARLALLDRAGAALAETLDLGEGLSRLAQTLVPALGDLVAIDVQPADRRREDEAPKPIVVGVNPDEVAAVRSADLLKPRRYDPESAVLQVIEGGSPTMIQNPLEELAETAGVTAEQTARWRSLPMPSALVVPMTGRGSVLGAVTLLRSNPLAVPYTEDDLTLAIEIGRRAGLMVDNAARFETQRMLAEALQRSLLPELPQIQGIELVARYEPSSAQAMVGGDWYDAFPLPGGGLALVIGDVMGHDIAAATAMGQLRSVLRSCAADGDRPADVLDRLDRLVDSFAMADLATVVYARLDRHSDGSASMSYANAGHPPPLLLSPDGSGRYLREAASTMIGAPGSGARNEAVVELPPGATLLMYTDGVVERRRIDLGERLEVLRSVAGRQCVAAPSLDAFGEAVMREMQRDAETDDAALLAVRVVG
jgi:serine phosphatase RsbU (regulator of sigma subunit)